MVDEKMLKTLLALCFCCYSFLLFCKGISVCVWGGVIQNVTHTCAYRVPHWRIVCCIVNCFSADVFFFFFCFLFPPCAGWAMPVPDNCFYCIQQCFSEATGRKSGLWQWRLCRDKLMPPSSFWERRLSYHDPYCEDLTRVFFWRCRVGHFHRVAASCENSRGRSILLCVFDFCAAGWKIRKHRKP